jgi:hypothetical protein
VGLKKEGNEKVERGEEGFEKQSKEKEEEEEEDDDDDEELISANICKSRTQQ